MSLRAYVERLERQGRLVRITAPISKTYEIAAVLKKLEPTPVIFESVRESGFAVLGNLCCTKAAFADYLGIEPSAIIPTLARAIDERRPGLEVGTAPCQQVVLEPPNLDALPILRHFASDGGNYVTAGVFVAAHPRYGQNVDFHRAMQFSRTEMAVRVVRGRDFDTFLQELGQVDVAICVGNAPHVLAAAATSIETGVDELEIANALQPLSVVRARTVDVLIPAEAEFVLEGTVYRDRRHAEGPFVDLTETRDAIRHEPVLVVKAITHRRNAIWHALLPGGLEHKLLMGMPREPTIFARVNEVVRCRDVHVNPGGCSWLHAVVQIDKRAEDDGIKAIHAAFAGHRSCKHVFVVDADIDIYNPLAVEWAMATRFQADTDLVVKEKERGSSLDPSAEPGTSRTTKAGFDLTKPLAGEGYDKEPYPEVDTRRFCDSRT
ncbi:MAG: UbiD family decarboxylase [Anaerolineae bacterium]|nr:UbiD family decarboxylase [Anaerolineae bacterium]